MEISSHIKTKWTIRGDYTRTASGAWANGVAVRLPNYNYGQARLDTESQIVLLTNGDKVTTAITLYDHMEIIPMGTVHCEDCGKKFRGRKTCPSCESEDWK